MSRVIGCTLCASGHNNAPASDHTTETAPSLQTMIGHAGLAKAYVRSLFDSEKHLLHFTNFSTLAQMCKSPSVPPCAHVLAYFHKHF
jgi:hypothetical protein